jgi:hypothetical protein
MVVGCSKPSRLHEAGKRGLTCSWWVLRRPGTATLTDAKKLNSSWSPSSTSPSLSSRPATEKQSVGANAGGGQRRRTSERALTRPWGSKVGPCIPLYAIHCTIQHLRAAFCPSRGFACLGLPSHHTVVYTRRCIQRGRGKASSRTETDLQISAPIDVGHDTHLQTTTLVVPPPHCCTATL